MNAEPLRGGARALTGNGEFTADLIQPGDAVAVFYRSPVAHARIELLDVTAARRAPGVLGVFLRNDLLEVVPAMPDQLDSLKNRDGSPAPAARRPLLADKTIGFAGEALALIIAETAEAAEAASDLVVLEIEELPTIIALDDVCSEDLTIDWATGAPEAVDMALVSATHVVSLRLPIPRLAAVPMEPAGARAEWDDDLGVWILTAPSQGVHTLRNELADHCLRVPRDRLRVVTPDVGGAFGARIHIIPEQAALLGAARLLRRPVAWMADRMETALVEPHARDFDVIAELGLSAEGEFLAVKINAKVGHGAYVHPWSRPCMTSGFFQGVLGPYRICAAAARVRGYRTNATPIGPFRGAGEPEGCHVMESLIDEAADLLGRDPIDLRNQNLLAEGDFPYQLPSGLFVDSGDPAAVLHELTERIGRAAPRPEPKGWLRGAATALYMKKNGVGRGEEAEFRLTSDGRLRIGVGSQCNGQGHATTFANLAARQLGIPASGIDILQGDTEKIAFGGGTGGSSALGTTGTGVVNGCAALRAACESEARAFLGTEDCLEYADGIFRVRASNLSLTLAEIAEKAGGTIEVRGCSESVQTFTFGAHHAAVAVDPGTGNVRVLRYLAVDDLGPIQEPALAAGQIVGGVTQGIAQALMESFVIDPRTGQPYTASLMDYALIRAEDLCEIETAFVETATPMNPLGIRGAGEAGAIPSMTVVVAAVNRALARTGSARLHPPLTACKVWQALSETHS